MYVISFPAMGYVGRGGNFKRYPKNARKWRTWKSAQNWVWGLRGLEQNVALIKSYKDAKYMPPIPKQKKCTKCGK